MASSFSRKSSSSASNAPKPTYRRAGSTGRSSAAKPKVAPAAKARVTAPKAKTPHVKAAPGRTAAAPRAKAAPKAVKVPKTLKTPKAAAAKPAVGAVMPALGKTVPAGKRNASKVPAFLRPVVAAVTGVFAAVGRAVSGVFSHLNIPKPSRGALLIGVGAVAALALAAVVVANSALFAATDIQVRGSAHVEQETARALVEVPEGTTLMNYSKEPILESLSASPWVKDVQIERVWPHGLVITPVERAMRAVAYIPADEIAWAVGEDGTWIAPLASSIALDAEGNEVDLNPDGTVPEGAVQLSPHDVAERLAQQAGALLLTDVPSDVSPKSGEPVTAKVVTAGLEYANGFTPEFRAQIKSLSVASVEAISANLVSGVEVSLGAPENITEKERVITKLLEQESGVTYINVREPGAYTFRAVPL